MQELAKTAARDVSELESHLNGLSVLADELNKFSGRMDAITFRLCGPIPPRSEAEGKISGAAKLAEIPNGHLNQFGLLRGRLERVVNEMRDTINRLENAI